MNKSFNPGEVDRDGFLDPAHHPGSYLRQLEPRRPQLKSRTESRPRDIQPGLQILRNGRVVNEQS